MLFGVKGLGVSCLGFRVYRALGAGCGGLGGVRRVKAAYGAVWGGGILVEGLGLREGGFGEKGTPVLHFAWILGFSFVSGHSSGSGFVPLSLELKGVGVGPTWMHFSVCKFTSRPEAVRSPKLQEPVGTLRRDLYENSHLSNGNTKPGSRGPEPPSPQSRKNRNRFRV